MDRRSALVGGPLCKNTLQAGARPIDERWVAGQVCQLPVVARRSTPPQVTGQMVNLPMVAATTQSQKQQAERANVPCSLRLCSCPDVDIAYPEPHLPATCLHCGGYVPANLPFVSVQLGASIVTACNPPVRTRTRTRIRARTPI